MKAKITDKYSRNLFDMDIIVKGDVTGDGNISITDIVKVKRHIEQIDSLNGVYEIAGNITGLDDIEDEDLEILSKDLAGIEEVK